MCGEEADAADVGGDVVEDGAGDGDAVVGRGAAAELVEDDEGSRRGFGQDLLRFREFDEESGLGGEDVIVGAQAGHDSIDGRQTRGATGDIATHLGHDDGDASLSTIRT